MAGSKALRRVGISALGAACLSLYASGATVPVARAATTAPACSAGQTQVSIGLGEGGGFAGGTVVPVELSNVGSHACTLLGYPGVSAYRGALRQIGPAAARIPVQHSKVTLPPGATAHSLLKITDAGIACGRSAVSADGLRIYPPGQRAAKTVTMPLRVCMHRGVLATGPVRSGVGVPGQITQ